MRTSTLVVGIALIAAALAVTATRAQEQPGILPSLLVEVRGLRAAIEQMASAGPRVQLALGRLQLQEQRLNTLLMKLDGIREKLAMSQRLRRARAWRSWTDGRGSLGFGGCRERAESLE